MKKARIVFMGSPEIAVPSLKALIENNFETLENIEVIEVWTQPDRPKGRGQKMQAPAIKIAALEHNIPVLQPHKIKDLELIEHLVQLKPDLIVVIAYGKILPPEIIHAAKLGCLNVHFSLLPKYRGASCVAQAILNGDSESGVTTMFIQEGEVDSGAILMQEKVLLTAQETTFSLSEKLSELAPKILLKTIEALIDKSLIAQAQDESQKTLAAKISKEDARLNYDESPELISRKCRAYQPWPGLYSEFNEKKIVIVECEPIDYAKNSEDIHKENFVYSKTQGLILKLKQGTILIQKIKPQGKQTMDGAAFARGYLR